MSPERARESPPRKWYREPYVWLLIAFPLLAVIGGSITAILALESDDGLVVDDYYNQGLEINRVLDRDRRAATLGLKADLQLSPEHDRFRLILSGNTSFTLPDRVNISFLHATRAGLDRRFAVNLNEHELFEAGMDRLALGRWYVQIEAADWRILKTITIE